MDDTGLADLLRGIQLDGVFYCPSFLSEPWGVSLPPMDDCIWFHVVTSGAQWLLAHSTYWSNPAIGDNLVDMLWG